MKKTLMALLVLEVLAGGTAIAQTSPSGVSRALKKFEGTYQLVAQKLSQDPRSDESAICHQIIQVERPQGPNCQDCEIDLEVIGLPLGQGLIVQMTKTNQGRQIENIENPMFPGIIGTSDRQSEVRGSKLSYLLVNRDLTGKVNFSTEFQAVLKGDILEYRVHNTRAINGFAYTMASCRYQR